MYDICAGSPSPWDQPGAVALHGGAHAPTQRPRLPSFHEFTESLASDEEDSLSLPIPLPLPRLPASPPSSRNPFTSSKQHGAYPRLASFVPPRLDAVPGSPVGGAALPNAWYSNNNSTYSQLPCTKQEPTPPPGDTPPQQHQQHMNPIVVDERMCLQSNESIVPRSYAGAVKAIASASSILYDFGERLSEQCRREQGPDGATFACLPSPFEIHMMTRNVAAMRRSLGDIKIVVENATEEASSASVTGGGSMPGGAGVAGEEVNVLCVPSVARSTTTASGAVKKRKKRGGKTKKTLPAPNPAGKCYNCGSVESTEWRRGPEGLRTLCNPCGICYSKAPLPSENDVGGWAPAGVVGGSTEKLA
ncbi:hypothetical protein QBC34DRAFT_493360 [Podospora aff. communis PSN243]|uniref:GATA-type domain-containing protein n=1 Tax=Podospora aff. communis PSN243 TaxID=3040156 RepID=A0AAV9GUJ7_9PEZI|nr:hypothetical protein QBC34DRAFT_493360 [Podospora aff. communis PSN243]